MFGLQKNSRQWIVYVSTFPPRECGIATFTQDLMNTFDELYMPREESKVVAINLDSRSKHRYDLDRVIYQITQPDKKSYLGAARYLNSLENVSVVNIQHEFGIFGGEYGSYILDFMNELRKPIVLTLHTVLPGPNPILKKTVEELGMKANTIIVMTETSKKILATDYTIDASKIKIIPHGIHPKPFSDGKKAKAKLGLSGKMVLSTFGLLSKGKGIEYGIESLPEVVKRFPNVEYHVIGATHPVILAREGESYRKSLIKKVEQLGLRKHVIFHNKYFDLPDLLNFLEATDIYLALSLEPNQAVSGTFSYALGAGRPVIATRFAQAKEDITEETGLLVDFKNPEDIKNALLKMLKDPTRQKEMGKRAYFRTRSKTWHNCALLYMKEYITLAPSLSNIETNLPKIKLDHIFELTDKFGMIQFTNLTTPDPSSGYTLDDNARALIAVIKYCEERRDKSVLELAKIYLNFIDYVAEAFGDFSNYVNYDRTIPSEKNRIDSLEDARARALESLAIAASSNVMSKQLRTQAYSLYDLSANSFFPEHPRSMAFFLKSLTAWITIDPSVEIKTKIVGYADKLVELYEKNSTHNWQWFGDSLTYSNGLLPEALALAFRETGNEKYLSVAKTSLEFLILYSFQGDICVPIGQKGWFQKGGEKQLHDQQPEEVATLVQTLKTMYEITGEERYQHLMMLAFGWFTGNNLLRQVVYDYDSGGCYDGVGKDYVNLNQGAESTVMYLLARLAVEKSSTVHKKAKSWFERLTN
ncbi:MAG: glycosyltransferase [Patescibacteria group bacterium]